MGDFLPGVFGPCQMPPSEQRGCPALLPWMNANEGVCVCLNVIHTTSNWACKEVQNWGWQPPKPNQPGRMSDITCAWDTVHAWIIVQKKIGSVVKQGGAVSWRTANVYVKKKSCLILQQEKWLMVISVNVGIMFKYSVSWLWFTS